MEYEKVKFQEFLANVDDGLSATREWLVGQAVIFGYPDLLGSVICFFFGDPHPDPAYQSYRISYIDNFTY